MARGIVHLTPHEMIGYYTPNVRLHGWVKGYPKRYLGRLLVYVSSKFGSSCSGIECLPVHAVRSLPPNARHVQNSRRETHHVPHLYIMIFSGLPAGSSHIPTRATTTGFPCMPPDMESWIKLGATRVLDLQVGKPTVSASSPAPEVPQVTSRYFCSTA